MRVARKLIFRYKVVAIAVLAAAALVVGPAYSAAAAGPQQTSAHHVDSAATAKKAVPKVVGKTAYAAKNALTKAGFKYSYSTPKGTFVVLSKNWTVIKQSPKAGSQVKVGTNVKLTVVKTSTLGAAPGKVSPYGAYPTAEAAFVKTISTAAAAYQASSTGLQKSQIIANRDAALCAAIGGNHVDNWVGTIHDIGANGDGYAWVNVEIAPTVVVQTWNNAFSDIGSDTLIHQDASFFQTLVPMKTGQKITFSGDFLSSSASCLDKENLTQTFYAIDPNFIFRFSNVTAQ